MKLNCDYKLQAFVMQIGSRPLYRNTLYMSKSRYDTTSGADPEIHLEGAPKIYGLRSPRFRRRSPVSIGNSILLNVFYWTHSVPGILLICSANFRGALGPPLDPPVKLFRLTMMFYVTLMYFITYLKNPLIFCEL